MKSKTKNILAVMHVLAWITFLGLLIKAGAILISYGLTISNPEAAIKFYRGLDLYGLRQFNFWHYTLLVALMVALIMIEVGIAYLVIRLLSRIKLVSPFSADISKIMEKISYNILGAWIVAMVYNIHMSWLVKRIPDLQENHISGEFIFLAGVVFVFAQIFKKGVELQTENELTV